MSVIFISCFRSNKRNGNEPGPLQVPRRPISWANLSSERRNRERFTSFAARTSSFPIRYRHQCPQAGPLRVRLAKSTNRFAILDFYFLFFFKKKPCPTLFYGVNSNFYYQHRKNYCLHRKMYWSGP